MRAMGRAVKLPLYSVGLVPDRNGRRILALKDRHRGQRCFILGNGPSLLISDLSKLRNEITLASNKVYLAFDQTEWRPTYYSVCDKLVAKNNWSEIKKIQSVKVLSDRVSVYFENDIDAIWLYEHGRNSGVQRFLDGQQTSPPRHFSEDLMFGVDGGWTVIFLQLQLAFYMGITEVYLLGLDFSFSVPETRAVTKEKGYELSILSKGEKNHFHPDYRKPGEIWGVPRLDCQEYTFGIARERFEKSGRRVWNASRSTKLEVFEKVAFDSITGLQ